MQPPTYVEPLHDTDHELSEPTFDIDGFGVSQVDMVDGDELFVVVEQSVCCREGCDGGRRVEHLFTTESLPDALQAGLEQLCEYELHEHLFEWATMVDYDDGPVIGFESDEIYDAFGVETVGYCYAETIDMQSNGVGVCNGWCEPEPDVDAYRYEEL